MIVIVGGSGFVGSALVKQLHKAGVPCRVVVRHPGRFRDPELTHSESVVGDIRSVTSLESAFQGAKAVINLVGILAETGGQTFEEIHYQGTCNVIAACKNAQVERLLQMSALGTRPAAQSLYHQTKWKAEEKIRISGLNWTIFRPSVIFGQYDDFANRFASLLRFSPIAPLIGDGTAKMQPVWVEDVATCFRIAIDDERTMGQTFELGGPEQLSFNQIMQAILDAMDIHRPKLGLPMPLLKLEASLFEKVLPNPPLTNDQLIMASEDNITDQDPLRELFRLTPRRFADELPSYIGRK
ncbi:MAG: complex I NDUFA9 subunit family protein [Magnetococcales bacterium]|nr:complex I NDUFA9 subunit family protein [Magnetococcales bacterium]